MAGGNVFPSRAWNRVLLVNGCSSGLLGIFGGAGKWMMDHVARSGDNGAGPEATYRECTGRAGTSIYSRL